MNRRPPRHSPFAVGAILLGIGVLLRLWRPSFLDLPERPRGRSGRGLTAAAHRTQDGIAAVLPGNLTGGVGRSLILLGAGLIALRALDEIVDDDQRLF
ncbi:hypothetical protein [Profundibacterium mesophilum]|uniref:Glucosyltransferase MdoH n=1 Tax=Profundibacterium mesophilum KAUST100406-0324 TaxID=1037889 RepID=A0A921NXV5_9RHOB|nr:hypothetical protein [Profundibacterium mesophilum]KAF0677351.1 glucosyltransferase MdoH [Profundibacterium mesophilum KAUST100406-0324]